MQKGTRPMGEYISKEIEVTPEMIRAGLKVYLAWLPDDARRSLDEEALVRDMFVAMYDELYARLTSRAAS
jgi:hypothetical protein